VVIWYIFPVLVFCTKKNLATLDELLPPEKSVWCQSGSDFVWVQARPPKKKSERNWVKTFFFGARIFFSSKVWILECERAVFKICVFGFVNLSEDFQIRQSSSE
jgi:hypothetical protein